MSKIETAIELLECMLEDGPRRVVLIRKGIEKYFNISWVTIKRAKKIKGIVSFKKCYNGIWWWRLPETTPEN